VVSYLTTKLFPEQTFVDHLSDRRESLYGKTVRMIERDYQQVLGYPIPVGKMVVRALKSMCSESRIGLRHSRDNVCGRTPNLTMNELREATVDAPFVESSGPVFPPTKGTPPEVEPPTTQEPGPESPVSPRTTVENIRCLPKPNPGGLRIEVASRLAPFSEVRIQEVTLKIFFQSDAGDVSSLPSTFRGSLSGSGSITAEIQIRKQGNFSKAEVEQMVEALPSIAGATYDAQLRVMATQEEAHHA
jgi:hypothetical protein